MKFDTKENAVVRSLSLQDIMSETGDMFGQLRLRFTDGRLFSVSMNIEKGISPLEIANYFISLGEDIKNIYCNEIKNNG